MLYLLHDEIEDAVREFAPILPGMHMFPVRDRRPVRGLPWTQRSSADAVERAALAELPHDGWAVHCGPSGLLVVDLDEGHEEGVSGLISWCDLLDADGVGHDGGNPRVVGATPRGGRHLYYGAVPDVGNRAGVLPGVDVRAGNGYVVISGEGRSLTVIEWAFPRVPTPFLNLLGTDDRRATPAGAGRSTARSIDRITNMGRALRTASDKLAAAGEGQRNDLLNGCAFVVGRDALAAGLAVESVERVLLDAARECGLSDRESLATIRSGLGVPS